MPNDFNEEAKRTIADNVNQQCSLPYQLFSHCHLILGASGRGAIYDLRTGRVFSVNRKAAQIIRAELPDHEGYWQTLAEAHLATQGDISAAAQEGDSMKTPPTDAALRFISCELTAECNARCLHCYGSFGSPSPDSAETVDWGQVLRQAAQLKARQIQFIGGEPLLRKDRLFALIALARQLHYDFIEVFTNGTLISSDIARYFAECNVNVAVSLYSNVPEIHDAVTQQRGSFANTSNGLRLLKEHAIPIRVAIIGMARNQETLATTVEYAQSCGAKCRQPDIIRPTGRGHDHDLLPREEIVEQYARRAHPSFFTSRYAFWEAHSWNTCWKGQLTVTATGDVLPCVFARTIVAGNVNQSPLATIIAEALMPYWRLTLDEVETCRDCEYRYACHNCRPLSEGAFGKLRGRNPRCGYDPQRGQWQGKE